MPDQTNKSTPAAATETVIGAPALEPQAPALAITPPGVEPPSRAKQAMKQLIGIALAVAFLWFSFKNVDVAKVWAKMQNMNLFWGGAVCVSALLSHWLRAVRWVIMLQPLADNAADRPKGKISSWNSFCAVMFGYAVNIAIPRGGEVVRILSICKTEKLPWAGVVPTMLIDRLLDFAMLVLLLGVTLLVLPPDIKSSVAVLVPVGAGLCVATIGGLVLMPKMGVIMRAVLNHDFVKSKLPEKLHDKVQDFADQFEQGTICLSNPVAYPAIGALTVFMWFLYFMNMELMLFAFGMEKAVDPIRALIVFAISSIGVIAPTPGGFGSYHLAASKALTMVAGVEPNQAMAFVTAFHGLSFVVIVCVASLVCFVVESVLQRKKLQRGG